PAARLAVLSEAIHEPAVLLEVRAVELGRGGLEGADQALARAASLQRRRASTLGSGIACGPWLTPSTGRPTHASTRPFVGNPSAARAEPPVIWIRLAGPMDALSRSSPPWSSLAITP